MGSKSPGTQTTTTNSAPWSGQQPYLQDIMSEGQRLYGQGPQQYFDQSTVVPFSNETQTGMGMIANQAQQPAWGADAARASLNSTLLGNQPNQLGVLSQAAQGGLSEQSQLAQVARTATPYTQDIINNGGRSNSAGLGQMEAGTQGNALLGRLLQTGATGVTAGNQVFEDSASGRMLDGNPYLDRQYNRAAERVRDNTNAAFSRAGRYGSGAHSGTLSDSLSDMAAQMYGGAYETERNRQFQAAGELGNRQAGDLARNLQAQQFGSGLEESRLGRTYQFGQDLGQRQLGDISRAGDAYRAAAGIGSADLQRQMSGLGMLSDIRLNAANAANSYGLQQASQGMQAAGMLPGLRQYEQSGARDLINLGQMQEGKQGEYLQDQINRWNFNQQAPWDQLGRYSGVVGGLGNLGGSSVSTGPEQSRGNPLMGALSGGAAGAGISSALRLTGPWGWGVAGLGALAGLM